MLRQSLPHVRCCDEAILGTHAFLEFHFQRFTMLLHAGRQSEVLSVLRVSWALGAILSATNTHIDTWLLERRPSDFLDAHVYAQCMCGRALPVCRFWGEVGREHATTISD
jgi:hypothetical protein